MMRGMAKKDRVPEAARAAFPSAMDAKTFIAERIGAQAKREGVALDELERKSLYFSEVDEAPPDALEVAREFDSQHDSAEYEEKIAGLAERAYAADASDASDAQMHQRWINAIARIDREDHYILVMLGQAGLRSAAATNRYKWIGGGFVVGAIALLFAAKYVFAHFEGGGYWASLVPKAIAILVVGAIVWSMLPARKRS
jgi:hypothetical protein